MAHELSTAPTGRARCRGCGAAIAKGALRFGERIPNPFADEGETTLWFHPACGACKRPEPFLEALAACGEAIHDAERLAAVARLGLEHRRLPRIDGAERASSGRAACRACREKIAKDAWRIRLVFYDEGRFEPSGFVHAACAGEYFGTRDVVARARRFSAELSEADAAELERALG